MKSIGERPTVSTGLSRLDWLLILRMVLPATLRMVLSLTGLHMYVCLAHCHLAPPRALAPPLPGPLAPSRSLALCLVHLYLFGSFIYF